MAIEPLQHVTLLAPRGRIDELTGWLQELALVHIDDAAGLLDGADGESEVLKKPTVSTDDADAHIRRLRRIQDIFSAHGLVQRSLAEMFVTLPTRVTVSEREDVVGRFDYMPLYEQVVELDEERSRHLADVERAREELHVLEFFRSLPFEPEDIHALGRVRVWIGSLMADKWEALRTSEAADNTMALAELRRRKRTVDVCVLSLADDAEEVARRLRTYGLNECIVPRYEGTRTERMDHLTDVIRRRHEDAERCRTGLKQFGAEVRSVDILLGYWEAERTKNEVRSRMLDSRRIALLSGYIREKDVEGFRARLAQHFPSVSDVYRAPVPEDDPPVEITNSALLRPVRFLVDMFGRPDYFSFDPTPFLALSFLFFFGMCYGDVVYGLALAALGYGLARKARPYEGLHSLCMLFCYAGVFTMIVGALMGSWASDLWSPAYLGEGNLLYRVRRLFVVVDDPIEWAVLLVIVSVGVGVVNQMYAIALKAYGLLRRGRVWDAVFDAGLWYVVLPGFLIAFSSMFFDMPPWLLRLGIGLLVGGGIGLILTQGREADGLVARFGVGLISIYGIMGSYGCISFLSDILSYARLVALGLTTTIVGMAFNDIASLVRDTPGVGIVLFVLIVLIGHTFNFMVGMLAAFVHPVRLTFLEFFNRFYEAGGVRFTPLSWNTGSMIVEPEE